MEIMKPIISKLLLGCTAACAVLLSSCNDAEYDVLENQAYIAQTNTNGNTAKKITIGNDAVSTEFNVRMSSPAKKNSSFNVSVDEAALEQYNKLNSTNYEILPTDQYTLSSTETTVAEGEATSAPVTISVKPLSAALKASGKKYAVPIKITSADGTSVLSSGNSIVYLLDQVIYQAVPTLNASNYAKMQLRQEYALNEWTVELNVNMKKLGKEVGEWNNQAIFAADGGDKDGEIYIRFGDAPIEGNRLQIKTQGSQMNSNQLFNDATWYHIAFVCTGTKLYLYVNGVLDNSMDLGGKVVNVANMSLASSGSWFRTDAMYSEVRFWTKARSQAEIANNMYVIDPTTDGLEAYWKMDEGAGDEFRDATGHGNICKTTNGEPTWTPNVRIDGK